MVAIFGQASDNLSCLRLKVKNGVVVFPLTWSGEYAIKKEAYF
jgi:hypothetical protein